MTNLLRTKISPKHFAVVIQRLKGVNYIFRNSQAKENGKGGAFGVVEMVAFLVRWFSGCLDPP